MLSLFFENLKISLIAVFANKVKSLLTALGIIIGVFSVTLMGTLISGLDRSFEVVCPGWVKIYCMSAGTSGLVIWNGGK